MMAVWTTVGYKEKILLTEPYLVVEASGDVAVEGVVAHVELPALEPSRAVGGAAQDLLK